MPTTVNHTPTMTRETRMVAFVVDAAANLHGLLD
jgi:hypothetical protein